MVEMELIVQRFDLSQSQDKLKSLLCQLGLVSSSNSRQSNQRGKGRGRARPGRHQASDWPRGDGGETRNRLWNPVVSESPLPPPLAVAGFPSPPDPSNATRRTPISRVNCNYLIPFISGSE